MFQELCMKHNCTFLSGRFSLFLLFFFLPQFVHLHLCHMHRTHELISIAFTLSVRKYNLNGVCRPDGQNRKQTKTPRSPLHRRKNNAHFTRLTHHSEFVASKRQKVINNTLTSPTPLFNANNTAQCLLDAECQMEESHKTKPLRT